MNEFDEVDFPGVYSGATLMKNIDIKRVPWDVGHSQAVVEGALDGMRMKELLDVGCGIGENAEHVASRGVQVTAVDFSEDAINEARQRHPQTSVLYKHHDIFQVENFWHEKFDVVLDSATYHAIRSMDRLRYLKILYGYLKPGGAVSDYYFRGASKRNAEKVSCR